VEKRKRPRKLPASWLEEWTRMERVIQESPPTKRHERKVTRHQSDRMRRVQSGQTPDTYKAGFQKADAYPTPVSNETLWLWPKDMNLTDWPTGKATDSRS
jgi:hypothetical protein